MYQRWWTPSVLTQVLLCSPCISSKTCWLSTSTSEYSLTQVLAVSLGLTSCSTCFFAIFESTLKVFCCIRLPCLQCACGYAFQSCIESAMKTAQPWICVPNLPNIQSSLPPDPTFTLAGGCLDPMTRPSGTPTWAAIKPSACMHQLFQQPSLGKPLGSPSPAAPSSLLSGSSQEPLFQISPGGPPSNLPLGLGRNAVSPMAAGSAGSPGIPASCSAFPWHRYLTLMFRFPSYF